MLLRIWFLEVAYSAAVKQPGKKKNSESKKHILGTTARRTDAFIGMMEQKRDVEILARTSVKPYMDSDFSGPLLEGVTVLDCLREQNIDGH